MGIRIGGADQPLRIEEFRSGESVRRIAGTIFQMIQPGSDADLLRESFGSRAMPRRLSRPKAE